MATVHKDAIRKLLGKGSLSGFEVARLLLAELWEDEHHRDPILNENEERTVLNHLSDPKEVKIYNDWIGAFAAICEVNHTAQIVCLMAQADLSNLGPILEKYVTSAFVKLQLYLMPTIVTEKQFQGMRAQHRRSALRKSHSLGFVLFRRADELAGEENRSLEGLLEDDPEKAIHSYRQACGEIRHLAESGRLNFTYQKHSLRLLERIETAKSDKEILALIEYVLPVNPKQLMTEPEPLLKKATTPGKGLYEAGLSEWMEWIEGCQHDALGEVAVIQNPYQHNLDRNGHYKNDPSFLENALFQPPNGYSLGSTNVTPQCFFDKHIQSLRFGIAGFLFFRMIMRLLEEKTGIGFSEDVDCWYRSLEDTVKSYEALLNLAAILSARAKQDFAELPPTVCIDELHPSSGLETLVRNRLASPLMKSRWFQDCKKYFLKERLSGLPREELEEVLAGIGREARKRVYGILESNSYPETAT